MKTTAILAATVALALSAAPGFAQQTKDAMNNCSADNLAKLDMEVGKISNASAKQSAMSELTMAKGDFTNGDQKTCLMRMEKVMKMLPGM